MAITNTAVVDTTSKYIVQSKGIKDETDQIVADGEKLKNGTAKEFKKGTSKIKPLQTFEQKLASISTEDELYGFANRRRVLGINLPEWNQEQVKAIKWRLMEIRKNR